MPESVTFDPTREMILVEAWGDDTIEDWEAARTRILQLHGRHPQSRLLVDVRQQTTTPSTTDIYHFAVNWPAAIRCALLVGEKTAADQEFLSTVAQNRGKQMRMFRRSEDAFCWLGLEPISPDLSASLP